MESDRQACYLQWGNGKFTKTIDFDMSTNVPTFFSAASIKNYLAHKAVIARDHSFYCCETVRIPGQPPLVDPSKLLINNYINMAKNDSTVCERGKSKSLLPPICMGPLTFSFQPQPSDADNNNLEANNLQAKLIRWYYCLGHLLFASLCCLPKNGEIWRKL